MKTIGLIVLLAGLTCGCASTHGGRLVPARFDCDDGSKLSLIFDHEKDAVEIAVSKGNPIILPSKHPDAGMWYLGTGYELRGAGDTLAYTAPDRAATRCVQVR